MKSVVHYRIFINAEPASVFGYLSNLTLHSEWSGAPLKVEELDQTPVNCIGQVTVEQKPFTTETPRHRVFPLVFSATPSPCGSQKCAIYS